ncbi:MAG TPA: DUF3016 domain-containing protein [Chthoniobacterales bacterium]
MKTILLSVMLLVLFTGLAVAKPENVRPDRVSVEFIHPEKFIDVGRERFTTDRERTSLLNELAASMRKMANAYLGPGLRLDIQVTEVDMAGGFEPWRRQFRDARIVKDVYPPRINLTFRLSDQKGKFLREGERKLTDLSFLTSSFQPNYSDSLYYEKALIRNWLSTEFRNFRKS